MGNRTLEKDKNKANQLKKLLPKANNATERKRIQIVISYLNGLSYKEIKEAGISEGNGITSALKKFKYDPDNFYKTNWTGRNYSHEWNNITEKIQSIIDEKNNNGEIVDIQTVQKEFNKRHKNIKILNYKQTWYVVRERLKLKYQKPYIKDSRQMDNAKEELDNRVKKGYNKVKELENEKLQNKKIQKGGIGK